jgi:tetratricopeptide (TPR) repeat protein
VRTLYRLGQAYLRRGLWRQSVVYFRQLADRYPKHYLADDAIYLIADAVDRSGRKAEAQKLYAELLRRFPSGDMSFEARWRLGYQAFQQQKWERAIPLFAQIYTKYPRNRYAPAATYYAALAHQRQNKPKTRQQALALYRQMVERYPLHYYSFLALSRISSLTGQRWALRRCQWQQTAKGLRCQPVKSPKNRKGLVDFPWGDIPLRPPSGQELTQLYDGQSAPFLTHPAYLRGRELFRLELIDEAIAEWQSLLSCKVFYPAGKPTSRRTDCGRRGDPGAELLGLHFYVAGVYHLADRVYRIRGQIAGRIKLFALETWYLAYPRPFFSSVQQATKRDGVDLNIAYSIMREESTFRPDIQSRSNAYGLMQMLLSTAQHSADSLKLNRKIQPADLFQPDLNISLGIRHLRILHRQFNAHIIPMAGAYNAGAQRVVRWLERFAKLPKDQWVEAIPIEQTRHYVIRVSQTQAIYRLLYAPVSETIWTPAPFLPNRLLKK